MIEQRDIEDRLKGLRRVNPPADLDARIMRALPNHPGSSWPIRLLAWRSADRPVWIVPAYAAAVALLLAAVLTSSMLHRRGDRQVRVLFELRAPAARSVELLGSFNAWQTGTIRLDGPDGSGHWTTTLELPAGRHEYIFLVDGRQWVADPRAGVRRPDGFGHENAVIEI